MAHITSQTKPVSLTNIRENVTGNDTQLDARVGELTADGTLTKVPGHGGHDAYIITPRPTPASPRPHDDKPESTDTPAYPGLLPLGRPGKGRGRGEAGHQGQTTTRTGPTRPGSDQPSPTGDASLEEERRAAGDGSDARAGLALQVGVAVRCHKHGATTIQKLVAGLVYLGCGCHIAAPDARETGAT